MPDLIAYLQARLDEEERAAIAAGTPRAGVPTEPSWEVQSDGWDAALPDGCGVVVAPDGDGVAVVHGSRRAEHIARWDPARVLAEVAAKRAVLDEHRPVVGDETWCVGCNASFQEEWMSMVEECPTLRALAQVWAEHPDFDPTWQR